VLLDLLAATSNFVVDREWVSRLESSNLDLVRYVAQPEVRSHMSGSIVKVYTSTASTYTADIPSKVSTGMRGGTYDMLSAQAHDQSTQVVFRPSHLGHPRYIRSTNCCIP
jgi:hypothetical protein